MIRTIMLSALALASLTATPARATRPPTSFCVICTLFFDPFTQTRYWGCPPASTGAVACVIGTGGQDCINQGFCP